MRVAVPLSAKSVKIIYRIPVAEIFIIDVVFTMLDSEPAIPKKLEAMVITSKARVWFVRVPFCTLSIILAVPEAAPVAPEATNRKGAIGAAGVNEATSPATARPKDAQPAPVESSSQNEAPFVVKLPFNLG